jgi:MFS family permease
MTTPASAIAADSQSNATALTRSRTGTFDALSNRDFRFLLGGTMAANVAMWVQMIAQGWVVLEITGSSVALGVISFIRGIAMLVSSPFGGLLSDRFDRKLMMNVATAVSAVSASVMAVLVITGHIQLWQLFIFAAADGALGSVNQPARQALVYDVAGPKDLTNAVALQSIGMNIMRLLGPSLGGALIGVAGVGVCFAVQAGFYVLSVITSVQIRTHSARPTRMASLAESVLGGFRYARRHRPILLLLLVAALPSLLVYPYMSFMPLFSQEVLGADAFLYGVLITAVGVGSIIGALIAARKAGTLAMKGPIMLAMAMLYAGMVGVFALSHWYLLSYALLVVAGFANSINLTLNSSLVQFSTSDEYRGRVSGLYFMTGGLQPFGSLTMGGMIALAGLQPTVAAFCFAAVAVTLLLWVLSPTLRRM